MSNSSSANGTSSVDVRAQEVKGIGLPPLKREMEKSPLESTREKRDLFNVNDLSQSVTIDANAAAKRLTNLSGLPE
ncbi:MAG: hypothetical protein LBN94_02715 [Puniceicoccales bacterium]|nr:hypothetical protein [Puniceicoccales bacterium]